MNKYKQYIKEVKFLIGKERVQALPKLIVLFLLSSILDIVGIGLIAPYIAFIVDPKIFTESTVFSYFTSYGIIPPTFNNGPLIFISGLLVIIFATKSISAIMINKKILHFCFDHNVYLKSLLMNSYQKLPYTEYLKRNSSEYIHNINLASHFSQGILHAFLRLISEGIVGIVILLFLAWKSSVALGVLLILLSAFIFLYDRLFRVNIREYGRLVNKYSTEMIQGIQEGIDGLKEIRILGKEKFFSKLVNNSSSKHAYVSVRQQVISTAPRYILELVLVIFLVILVLGSLFLGADIKTLLPTLSMFGVAAMRLAPSTNQVITGLTQARFGRDTTRILYADVLKLSEQTILFQDYPLIQKRPEFKTLLFKDVKYIYPQAKERALDGISLKIIAGESIGLIGPSGSGKTTLVDVFLGLLRPQSGNILYNNQSLNNNLEAWRSQIAYLPQEVFIIDNDLRHNIALGCDRTEIDDQKVEKALQQASLSELIKQLPNGIHTKLGERGVRLSGGQRQRVALARAFYHARSILVMDESTSALDNETEREIVEEIKQLKGQKTLIVIAHRLTTLQYCDRIYRLENGKIVKQGTYEQCCT